MATSLFDPPPIFDLPFSKGSDLYFEFEYMPVVVDGDGNPILDVQGNYQYAVADYPVGSSAQLIVEAESGDLIVVGDIVGAIATFWEDKANVGPDNVKANQLWRVLVTYADGYDKVICNGVVKRWDGKPPR